MKVFKFGGASVKDANAIRNVAKILSLFTGEKLAVVVSAMGKSTNAFERIVHCLIDRNKEGFIEAIEERRSFHLQIMDELFTDKTQSIYSEINDIFDQLRTKFESPHGAVDFEYDQIVSLGEVISTKIIHAYLIQNDFSANWQDARRLISTDDTHQEAEVDWANTEYLFQTYFIPKFDQFDIQITQGFIGHTSNGATTTLGREGSDYTAGIIAFCSNADSVTIWKDVPGMLNADPKWFKNTMKLESISFREAIELSYYGASVIHPKTIKPLQNKNIPLFVKSFVNPLDSGTVIQSSTSKDHLVPSFIFKMNQVLFSFTPKDFSFINEKNLSDIFERLARCNAKINVMQNSALNFSILLDQHKIDKEQIVASFQDSYEVKFNDNLELITIRHYDQETIDRLTGDRLILLEQKTRETVRLVVRKKQV